MMLALLAALSAQSFRLCHDQGSRPAVITVAEDCTAVCQSGQPVPDSYTCGSLLHLLEWWQKWSLCHSERQATVVHDQTEDKPDRRWLCWCHCLYAFSLSLASLSGPIQTVHLLLSYLCIVWCHIASSWCQWAFARLRWSFKLTIYYSACWDFPAVLVCSRAWIH